MKALETLLTSSHFTDEELAFLLSLKDPQACNALYQEAFRRTTRTLGNTIYMRGLIEISNVCVYDCRYCGIRKHNKAIKRYSLSSREIIEATRVALEAGYGSIALQSGERDDPKFVTFIADTLRAIHKESVSLGLKTGCGMTLSFGEQSYETYRLWAEASGNKTALRYLLRLETSNPRLFSRIHGNGGRRKTLIERYLALADLKRAGYQVGTGVMVGIPGQTIADLVSDLRAFERIDPDMFGLGPYLVSAGGSMVNEGMMEKESLMRLTRNMTAVLRLMFPTCNIAAATALDALQQNGRILGVLAGCNVVMPNVTPEIHRSSYQLYDNKEKTETTLVSNKTLENALESTTQRSIARNRLGSSLRFRNRFSLPSD